VTLRSADDPGLASARRDLFGERHQGRLPRPYFLRISPSRKETPSHLVETRARRQAVRRCPHEEVCAVTANPHPRRHALSLRLKVVK
jgi:hypothetical protein